MWVKCKASWVRNLSNRAECLFRKIMKQITHSYTLIFSGSTVKIGIIFRNILGANHIIVFLDKAPCSLALIPASVTLPQCFHNVWSEEISLLQILDHMTRSVPL
jgi:hypothetical protein